MNQPLVQTQVIPYLRELAKGGHELTLLTFEPDGAGKEAVRDQLAADGIDWHWLRYHKRPSIPATMFDIVNGVRYIRRLNAVRKFDILHARSHVPMIMAALARKASTRKPKLLFDIRGFLPEEYVDAGVWSEGGAIYRSIKRVEAWLMRQADGFVVLTEKARQILADVIGSRPVEVIPCCVDFERRFAGNRSAERARVRRELGIEDRFVFVHIGALGGLYLTEDMADFLSFAREKNGKVFGLFLTQSDPQLIIKCLKERGFAPTDYFVANVNAAVVADYLAASDVGLSFVKSSFATTSRSPTKVPEYLACGLPVLANAGVGDTDSQLEDNSAGFLLRDMDPSGYFSAMKELEAVMGDLGLFDRLRDTARKLFDLEDVGGRRYKRIYQNLLG